VEFICVDGNEAAARIAYACSEVIAVYPITPASQMGEHADDWSAAGRRNLWGAVPDVIEMQSEGGAAGALHGALQKGALGTTFTASQGLLLMVPNMFKIAGELTPAVIHVAARAIATHALSIFGDHSDVMHARSTGWAMLCASSVQEAHDFALVAHAATLRARVPFLHFFDGFRTSHEVNRIVALEDADLRALIRDDDVITHRLRGLTPDAPVLRGTAQNPDVFFQAREAANPFYDATPGIVAAVMDELAARTGRRYGLVEYVGAPDAERVVVLMGSAAGAAEEAVQTLTAAGEAVGVLKVRLYRPFPSAELIRALPPTVRSIAVLDRTKEPGAPAEPLHLDVLAALDEAMEADLPPFAARPRVIGGRYGLASKEFTPADMLAVFAELARPRPKRRFTVGITDDVTHLSLDVDRSFAVPRPAGEIQALFYGLGADGTVGANKSSVKIIGEYAGLFAQGYFVYDSKKSGSVTVSHLRFGPEPIRATYLVEGADFVACHQFGLLGKVKILEHARPGATFLLNSPHPADEVWDALPLEVQQEILAKDIALWVIDADKVAAETGMGNRINTVMQPCFFQLSGVLPAEDAVANIKSTVEKTYGKRGRTVVERNFAAIDRSLAELRRVAVPEKATAMLTRDLPIPAGAPDFVTRVTALLLAGEGDLLPVSAMPVDGTFPTGTARFEKRAIGQELPIWDPEICIDCAKCAVVCPHAAIRMKVYEPAALAGAPETFQSKEFRSKDLAGHRMTIQVAPDDCTGCGVCVDVCPAKSKTEARHKSINMAPAGDHRDVERPNWDFFLSIPELGRDLLPHDSVKGSQALQPLFEFSGACAGCGETPYLKLLTQLFGDRIVVANATGCSSIYGANLPTTPWSQNADGRGPAWSNSLFEDNAEFGLGLSLGLDAERAAADALMDRLSDRLDPALVAGLRGAVQDTEAGIRAQRDRVARLKEAVGRLNGTGGADAAHLGVLADSLTRKGVWIVGGDGWAYDIGFGGLDHVLSSGRNVNVLVLDTEVYSNTGGQASKATPRGAVAKFAASGKGVGKKDLGAIARAYGNVYVAQIAIGANDLQATKALLEADAWPGPSLIIAYSTCIAHGIDMSRSMSHQKDAVKSGYWPLYRFQPGEGDDDRPFRLDSKAPTIPVADFVGSEARFAILSRTQPERAKELLALQQADVDERWRYYEQLAAMARTIPHGDGASQDEDEDAGPDEEER
jgi:pyruvate-ferredoxin/flavodoxin oxidoreductase